MPARIPVVASEAHLAHDGLLEVLGGREMACYERPARALAIQAALAADDAFALSEPTDFGPKPILAIHAPALVDLLEHVWADALERGRTDGTRPLIPDTFRTAAYVGSHEPAALPGGLLDRLGAYCFDTATPIVAGTYAAARAAVDVALSAAQLVLDGARVAYALCRPPGHHASRSMFGGYCFFNNAAIVAEQLLAQGAGRVAICDLDYHHGNGTQQLFWERGDVLYVSLHGDPQGAYPYFSGADGERGAGPGRGANRNFPLPPGTDGDGYLAVLSGALEVVDRFAPDAPLVVSLGIDAHVADPLGDLALDDGDYRRLGEAVGRLGRSAMVIQEGGYAVEHLGASVRGFLLGLRGAG